VNDEMWVFLFHVYSDGKFKKIGIAKFPLEPRNGTWRSLENIV